MEDFFKQFRDNLERRPPPSFEEQDWQDLEKRLDQQGEKRPAALVLVWLAWPLLFLSLGANALFFFQIEKDASATDTPETSRDTVFLTQTIFKTDTVYQTRFIQTPPRLVFSPSVPTQDAKPNPLTLLSLGENTKRGGGSSPLPLLQPLPSTLCRVSCTVNRLPSVSVEPAVSKQKKTLQYHLYRMRPKAFRLGLTGGWAYPFSEGLKSQGGFSAGAEAAVEFSPNLRLWGSATYHWVGLVTDRMGDDIGIPTVTPPSDDFVFLEAEAPQPSWEYGIGLQYSFNFSRQFKPFFGVGWGAVSLLPYEIVYDFENQALGVEWSLEKAVNRREFLTNLLLLRAGFESEFSPKWHWQLRASYRAGFEKTGFQTPDMFGVQAGLLRRF